MRRIKLQDLANQAEKARGEAARLFTGDKLPINDRTVDLIRGVLWHTAPDLVWDVLVDIPRGTLAIAPWVDVEHECPPLTPGECLERCEEARTVMRVLARGRVVDGPEMAKALLPWLLALDAGKGG